LTKASHGRGTSAAAPPWEAFGGPKGFAQATAMERLVRSDLDRFKELVEQER
jgi:hypothetical protein